MSNTKITGMDMVLARMSALDKNALKNLEMVVKKALHEIVKGARRAAPVDTGIYRKTLKFRQDGLGGYAAPLMKGSRVNPIGHLLEFGTVQSRAHPHLFPAFHAVVRRLKFQIEDAIRRAGFA